MSITWKFTSLDQMGAYFERSAQEARKLIPSAGLHAKNVLRSEAAAYEQAAMIVRNSVIEAPDEALASLDAAIAECAKPLPRHA